MFKFYTPSVLLAQYIKRLWSLSCHSSIESQPVRIIPHGCVELNIFYADKPQFKNRNGEALTSGRAILCGQKTDFIDFFPPETNKMFSVMFTPAGASAFFDFPMSEIKNYCIDLEDVIGVESRFLVEKLCESENDNDRFRNIESFLKKYLLSKSDLNQLRIQNSLNSILQNGGNCKSKDLSNLSCLSSKQFNRIFSEIIGDTPKQYMKIVRFQNAIYQKSINPNISLTQLSFMCGYYDQAHFVNDFKSISGMTPGKLTSQIDCCSDLYT